MAWIEQWKYSKVHKFQEEQTKGPLNIINHGYHTDRNNLVKLEIQVTCYFISQMQY